ncbi:hypothetical protein PQX77_003617 [Marasmius sp. AFHP31]|nr:hypothetical protein PQX77_003617 [Marasmius sp. AFHP31]
MQLVRGHFGMPALPGSSIADEMSMLKKAFALAKQRSVSRKHTITQYTARVCDILRDMHVLQRTRVLPVNRYSVDHYLDGLKILDRVLSSVAQVPSNSPPGGELAERVEQYTRTEEDRMDHVLQALGYEIDGQDTIELITSRYQIERNFLPLVYLLLRQHLTIIRTGYGRLLDQRELEIARKSLKVIFRAVKARVSMLEGAKISYPSL